MKTILLITLTALFSGKQPDAEQARQKVLDMAKEAVAGQYSEDEYVFEMEARWIPNSLLNCGTENILSVKQSSPLAAYTRFEVRYRHLGRLTTADIQLKVTMRQWLPVSAKRLPYGTVLSAEDLTEQWVEIRPGRDKPIRDIQKIEGGVLRRSILAFEPIMDDYLSDPFYVEAGEEVTLIYESEGFEITVLCEARQDGSLNEEITVFCKETRRKYLALVTGQGEASWLKTQ